MWQPGQQPATQQHSNCEATQQLGSNDNDRKTKMLSDLEASLPLLDVLLGMENDNVNFGHVEHPERDGRTERHGDGKSGCLDEHLWKERLMLKNVCPRKGDLCTNSLLWLLATPTSSRFTNSHDFLNFSWSRQIFFRTPISRKLLSGISVNARSSVSLCKNFNQFVTKSGLKGHFFKGHNWTTSLLFECFTGAPVKYAKTHTATRRCKQYWVLLCSLPVYASRETGNWSKQVET